MIVGARRKADGERKKKRKTEKQKIKNKGIRRKKEERK